MARSPTLELLVLFVVVFAVQSVISLIAWLPAAMLFALGPDFLARPWTLVTSVYAHASVPHLVSNAVALALVGFVLERYTTRLRFHLFFLTTGVVASVVEVAFGGFMATVTSGPVPLVIGASGAVFALYGYVIASNRLTDTVARVVSIPRWLGLGLFVVLAGIVTIATGSPGVALLAHFTGLLLGLIAGRIGVLDVEEPEPTHSRNATL